MKDRPGLREPTRSALDAGDRESAKASLYKNPSYLIFQRRIPIKFYLFLTETDPPHPASLAASAEKTANSLDD
jgi:hypothetical protein